MATRTSPPFSSPVMPPPPAPAQQIFVTPCSAFSATCSAACPELCSQPPPSFSYPYRYPDPEDPPSTDDSHALSPLLIALISILAAAFLLVSYYAFSRSRFFRRRGNNGSSEREFQTQQAESQVLDPNTGLDESLINRIALLKYRKNDGLVVSTDCSVCLGEFREEESLRLLPECTHAFHVECIDKWLEAHSNCPICRTGVISVPQPVQARTVPVPVLVPVPPPERENGSGGNVNGRVNDNVNGNNGDAIRVNNNPPLVRERERERGAGGLVVIVDPGQVGRVQEIIELGGDDPARPISRQAVFVARDIKPAKSNLMR